MTENLLACFHFLVCFPFPKQKVGEGVYLCSVLPSPIRKHPLPAEEEAGQKQQLLSAASLPHAHFWPLFFTEERWKRWLIPAFLLQPLSSLLGK